MHQALYVGGLKIRSLFVSILIVLGISMPSLSYASETLIHATLFSSAKSEEVISLLKENQARQAKNVEFGRKLRGVPYFHFKLSNEAWKKLEVQFGSLGQLVQTRRETAGSGVRVILWLKDLDYNQLFLFQNTSSEEALAKLQPSANLYQLLQSQLSKGQITIYENSNWKSGMAIYHRRIPTKLSQFDESAQISVQEKNKCRLEKFLKESNLSFKASSIRVPQKQLKTFLEGVVNFATVTLGIKSLDQDVVFRVDPKSLGFSSCSDSQVEVKPVTPLEATPEVKAEQKAEVKAESKPDAKADLVPQAVPKPVLQYEHDLNFFTYLDEPELRFTTQNGDCELESEGVKSNKLAEYSSLKFKVSSENSQKEILVKCLNRVDVAKIEKRDAKDVELRVSAASRKTSSGTQVATFQELKYKQKLERPFDVSADADQFQKRQIGVYLLATQNAADSGSITTAEFLYGRFQKNWYYGLSAQSVYAANFDSVLVGGAFVEYNLELPYFDSFLLQGRKSLLVSGRYYPLGVVNINSANNLYLELGGKYEWNSKLYLTMSLQNQKMDYSSSSSTRNSSVDVTLTSAFLGLGFQF